MPGRDVRDAQASHMRAGNTGGIGGGRSLHHSFFVECRSPLHQWGRCVGDHPSRRRLGKVYGVRLTMPRPACNPFRERQTLSMTRNGAWIPPSRSMRIACI